MQENRQAKEIFPGGGEMGARIRNMDWSTHPLGPIEGWSQSLKTIIRVMLTSRYAMWMGWGSEFYFFCNDAYLPTVGIKESWVLGASARKVWAEIWPDIGPRAESVVHTGQATWDEGLLLFLERSGYPEETYHTFSYSPVPDDSGSIGGMLCVVTEDTERVIGERRLAMLRDLASDLSSINTEKELFDAIERNFAVYNKDLPFALLYLFEADSKQARLSAWRGVTPGSEIAPSTIDLIAPDKVYPVHLMLDQAAAVMVDDLDERFSALPTGAWDKPPRQAVLIPIAQQGQEHPAGFLVAAINPYRPFDDAYKGFLNLLAGQIAAALSNVRAYEEERKRAEALAELDRAKTTFFSNVSHEFRTPLTLMLSPLEDALADHLPSETHDLLEVAHRNSLRLLKLVNTLLDFSRLEAGRVQAVYEAVDLSEFTVELASVFRSAIEKSGMRLTVNCPPLSEAVYIDREMWEKIVLNLLSNAFKFTFAGEIEVSLNETDNTVELQVRDTGVGIPEAELGRVFERFHRVQGVQGRTHEGTGIGLALVQELAALHGGTARVESEYGRGSTFIISIKKGIAHLPRISATQKLQSTAVGAMSYVEEALRWLPDDSGQWSGVSDQLEEVKSDYRSPIPTYRPPTTNHYGRILLADDNADMRGYLQRLLSERYEVIAVADGQAALEAARQQAPDLVLTDVMMPRLDGFGLIKELRRDPQLQTLPVIMLSARAGEEAKVEGLEAGADDYLIKPFSARELLARVRANLELSRLHRETAERERRLRGEADAALQQVEQVLSSINDAFASLDSNWRYLYVNDAAVAMMGKSGKEDFLGKTAMEVFPELIHTPFADALRQVMQGREPLQIELYYAPGNRWFENRIYPTADGGVSFFTTDITERKEAEKIFERYHLLSERARDIILYLRTDGQIIEANQAATEAYGYDHQMLLQMTITDLRASETLPFLANQLQQATNGGIQFETTHQRKDGTTFPVEVSARSAEIGDERFIVSIIRDIAERKRAELELAEAARVQRALYQFADQLHYATSSADIYEAALEAIINAMPCDRASILLFDQNGVMRFVAWRSLSDSYRQTTTGHSPWTADAINPQPILINELASADIEDSLKQVIAAEGIGALGFIPLVSEGRLIGKFMTYYNAPHTFRDEELDLSLTLARQLAFAIQRQRSEEALRKSEGRLRLATEAARMFTWEVDLPSRATFVSDNFSQVFGASAEAFPMTVEKVIETFSHPEDAATALEHLENAINSDDIFQQEFRFRNPDSNEMQWAEVRASVIRDRNGTPLRLLGITQNVTERKRAEQALRESEERFRTLADNMSQFAWMADEKGWIFWYNQRWYEYTGTTIDEMQGWGWQKVHHPDHVDRVVKKIQRSWDTGEVWEDTFPLRSKTGEYRWFLSRAVPIRDEKGKIVRWFGTNTDITASRQAAEALRESEERFSKAFKASPLVLTISSLKTGKLIEVNETFVNLTGFSREETIGKTTLELGLWKSTEDREVEMEMVRRGEQLRNIEYTFRTKTGGELIGLLAAERIDIGGEPFALTVIQDITGRKQVEEVRARLAAIVSSSFDAIASKTLDGIITSWNASAEQMFGYTAEEMIGQSVLRIMPPDRRAEEEMILARLRAGEAIEHYETVRVTKDGRLLDVSLTISPIKDNTGKIIGASKIVRDISDKKRIEEERERLLVSEQQARQQAEEANRLKDEFLATVSHELRTPLNAILGWASLARNSRFDGESVDRALTIIERNARNQNQIIADVLDVSRIITGKFHLDVQPVDLLPILDAAIDTLRLAIDARKIWLRKDFTPTTLMIMGDANRLQQVFWNLLSNAVKFTPEGGIIEVSVRQENHHVEVTVHDNGEGISPEFLPFVFDRFRQADGSVNRKHGGLGLGLAIVRHIIELHGGTAQVSSEGPNRGAAFTVRLPLMTTAIADNGQGKLSHRQEKVQNKYQLAGMRILVVDDEMDACLMMKHFLTQSGAEVVMAESVDEALERLKSAHFDLLISDIGMPEKDGFDLLQAIGNLNGGQPLPAIAVTAYARIEDRDRALAAGYQLHLAKPIDPDELIQAVARFNKKEISLS